VAQPRTIPIVRRQVDLARHDDQVVQVVGTYRVISTGPYKYLYRRPDGTLGKTDQIVRIATEGGSYEKNVMIGVRAEDEMAAFRDTMVVVTGTLHSMPPPPKNRQQEPDMMAEPLWAPSLNPVESIARWDDTE